MFADKVLCDKTLNIAKDPKSYGYRRGLASVVHNFLLKKSSDSGIKNICNRELAKELYKSIFGNLMMIKNNHLLLTIFGVQIQQICNL